MRYASIRDMDISNGIGIGVALFVQGCHRHCKGCFNPSTWDFNGGQEWTEEVQNKFLALIDKPFIKRVSILGGEPLDYENLPNVYDLVKTIKEKYPDKKIWLYTGYTLSDTDFCNINGLKINSEFDIYEFGIVRNCDIIVDGEYKEELRDLNLAFRGSSNQRVIDVKKTIQEKQIVLYTI